MEHEPDPPGVAQPRPPPEVDVQTAARLVDRGAGVLVDIREPEELAIAAIAGALHVPMQQIPGRLEELPSMPLLILCHSGMRSTAVTRFLRQQGIPASNVRGGIDAWSVHVDPQVPRY